MTIQKKREENHWETKRRVVICLISVALLAAFLLGHFANCGEDGGEEIQPTSASQSAQFEMIRQRLQPYINDLGYSLGEHTQQSIDNYKADGYSLIPILVFMVNSGF